MYDRFFMTAFDNIRKILMPDHPTHLIFELADRLKSQHFLSLILALCTIGFYAQVDQAGIGNIHQVKVSNYHLVPKHSVIRASSFQGC